MNKYFSPCIIKFVFDKIIFILLALNYFFPQTVSFHFKPRPLSLCDSHMHTQRQMILLKRKMNIITQLVTWSFIISSKPDDQEIVKFQVVSWVIFFIFLFNDIISLLGL